MDIKNSNCKKRLSIKSLEIIIQFIKTSAIFSLQANQYAMNRHRSLSGGTVPTGNQVNQFQFPDQFTGGSAGQMNMYNQQQTMYQNRMMRQMSLPPGGCDGLWDRYGR